MDGINLIAMDSPSKGRASPSSEDGELGRLFMGCADALYRFVLIRVGGDREAAADVVQQACCEAARRPAVPTENGACEAWLFGIARNLIRRHWRTRRTKGVASSLENPAEAALLCRSMESAAPIETLARHEATTQLLLAVTALPSGDQQLVFDVYFSGRSRESAAIERQMTAKALEARLYRIRRKLRRMLGGKERTNHDDE